MSTFLRTTAALLLAFIPFRLHAALADGYYDSTWIGGGATKFYGDPAHTTYQTYVGAAINESNGRLLVGGILIGNPAASWWMAELLAEGNFNTDFGIPYFHGLYDYGRVNACQLGLSCSGSSYGFNAVARQADGRVLVLSAIHLARIDASGSSLDIAGVTGGSGYVAMPVSINTGSGSVSPLAMVLDGNGKVLLAGTGYTGAGDTAGKFGLVRMNADLSVDHTFNASANSWGTLVRVDAADTAEYPTAMAMQPDGRVVVAGYGTKGGTVYFDIVRFKADGTPDGTFGNGGVAALSPSVAIQGGPSNIRVDALGRIVAALGNGSSIVVARVDTNGQADAAFGNAGYFLVSGSSPGCTNVSASAVAIDSAGRILAGGSCDSTFLVERIRGDKGILDTSFGVGGYSQGIYASGATSNNVTAIGFDPGGRLLVTGTCGSGIPQAGAARLTYDLIAAGNFEAVPRGCLPPDCQ